MENEKIENEMGKTIPIPNMGSSLSQDRSIPSAIISESEDSKQLKQINGSSSSPSSPTKKPDELNSNVNKAKSCKGCLYYSSLFKADSRNPVCVGLTRSLPNVPGYIVGQSEMEASKEGRSLTDFRYACVGYSLYVDRKEHGSIGQETQTELPVCAGLEVLVDRRVNRESGNGLPQRQSPKPNNSTGEDYFNRFTRNANLVANGVAKNVRRVGNRIKQGLDDVMYPYRRRPK